MAYLSRVIPLPLTDPLQGRFMTATKTERVRAVIAEEPALEPGPNRPPYLVALAAALAMFALYAITLGPTTWFWDTS